MAATAPSSGHIRKRQYQPSITSYLSRSNTTDGTLSAPARSPLSPPLPAETQASLLSVGMRVRKSVPEGYKTHKTLGTDGFPFPSTAPAATVQETRRPAVRYQSGTRELQPFCGLHKTGGFAQQAPSSTAPAAYGGSDADDEDEDVPGLSFSQCTVPSTQGSFMAGTSATARPINKRSYEEEIEDDLDAYFDEVAEDDEMERAPSAARRIAKPKATLRKAATDGVLMGGGVNDDFEEAAFLSPMEVDER